MLQYLQCLEVGSEFPCNSLHLEVHEQLCDSQLMAVLAIIQHLLLCVQHCGTGSPELHVAHS